MAPIYKLQTKTSSLKVLCKYKYWYFVWVAFYWKLSTLRIRRSGLHFPFFPVTLWVLLTQTQWLMIRTACASCTPAGHLGNGQLGLDFTESVYFPSSHSLFETSGFAQASASGDDRHLRAWAVTHETSQDSCIDAAHWHFLVHSMSQCTLQSLTQGRGEWKYTKWVFHIL